MILSDAQTLAKRRLIEYGLRKSFCDLLSVKVTSSLEMGTERCCTAQVHVKTTAKQL